MKPNRKNPLFSRAFVANLASLIVISGTASAGDVIKANNADALNLTSSWSGGVVPLPADVAVWNSTVAGAINPSLGADTTWQGLKITNPGGLVTIGSGVSKLTLTSSGIDMSAATQDAVLAPLSFDFSTNQTWTVAAGRNLRLAKTATGAANSDVDGTGTITVAGGGVIDANQGTAASTGFSGFSGKLVVEANTTLRGSGATTFACGARAPRRTPSR